MAEAFVWAVPRGDAARLELTRENEDGTPIDLTGWTASMFDVAPALVGLVAAAIVAPVAGRIDVTLKSAPGLSVGVKLPFRVALQPPAPASAEAREALPLFQVLAR